MLLSSFRRFLLLPALGTAAVAPLPSLNESDRSPSASVAAGLPLKPTRTLDFTVDEGTWMSIDVAPDGQSLVFDLLGDIYSLPIGGGTATRLTPTSLAVA